MPPVGRPRPDAAAYTRFASRIEDELDRAAAAKPNPGRTASFHRLNRVEYQNAVRDILGLDIDVASLLPGDDAAFGFDNIGEMLTVSPDLLDRYLSAANKITRLAVGDPSLQLGSATYQVSEYLLQDDRMSDDLPFGSRGGAAVRHYFPYTGEYVLKIRFAGIGAAAGDGRRAHRWRARRGAGDSRPQQLRGSSRRGRGGSTRQRQGGPARRRRLVPEERP